MSLNVLNLFNEQPPDFSTSQFTRLQNNDGRLSMVHFSIVKTIDFFDVWIGVGSSIFAKLKKDLRSRTGLNTLEVIDLRRLLKYSVSVNKFLRSWQDEKYILYFITALKFTSFLVRKTIVSIII